MAENKDVASHYQHGHLLRTLEHAISQLGKMPDEITVADLAPVDEFHVGGRIATEHLLDQLDIAPQQHLLDIGCGLGGAARFVAQHYRTHVTGIDLTDEYITTGNTLSRWTGMDEYVTLHQGDATDSTFGPETFHAAYMLHVGMNISDKTTLFNEVFRILQPQGQFAIYDIMQTQQGDLTYPVPWASDASTSCLASPEAYENTLTPAGFEVRQCTDRRDFTLDFFKRLQQKSNPQKAPPALGLHLLMKETAAEKIRNMVANIANGTIAPVEIIAVKRCT